MAWAEQHQVRGDCFAVVTDPFLEVMRGEAFRCAASRELAAAVAFGEIAPQARKRSAVSAPVADRAGRMGRGDPFRTRLPGEAIRGVGRDLRATLEPCGPVGVAVNDRQHLRRPVRFAGGEASHEPTERIRVALLMILAGCRVAVAFGSDQFR